MAIILVTHFGYKQVVGSFDYTVEYDDTGGIGNRCVSIVRIVTSYERNGGITRCCTIAKLYGNGNLYIFQVTNDIGIGPIALVATVVISTYGISIPTFGKTTPTGIVETITGGVSNRGFASVGRCLACIGIKSVNPRYGIVCQIACAGFGNNRTECPCFFHTGYAFGWAGSNVSFVT